jgi:Ca2+-binding EF-hand superfamily protein
MKIQTVTYVKMRSFNSETVLRNTERERIEFLLKQYQQYSNGELTCLQFVKSVVYKFGAQTDILIPVIKC